MSGDPPPHHPHNRPWDFIGISNWRQPQHAHMPHKHSIIHQPNWHPPTTESMKILGQLSHNFTIHQMFENVPAIPSTPPQSAPSQPALNQHPIVDLTITNQNGEKSPNSPISLSVKDAKKNTTSAVVPKKNHSFDVSENTKRVKPLDSVLERLKPSLVVEKIKETTTSNTEKDKNSSNNDKDENESNSKEEDFNSPYNTEDSLDSNKSRRKRKPTKTLRCLKDDEKIEPLISNPIEICSVSVEEKSVKMERRRSSSLDSNQAVPAKTRRKTSSESETIDNIAAMVQKGLSENPKENESNCEDEGNDITFVPVSVIQMKNEVHCQESTVSESVKRNLTPAQKKETHFVEIENKLEEMFAGIENVKKASNDVSSTSEVVKRHHTPEKNRKVSKKNVKPTKKKPSPITAVENIKEHSNDSTKSKGPFVHITGPRASPISVDIVNTSNEEELKTKSRKFHDDTEYRHKVRSKGLHCSTLSHKYDAQTKDSSWICVFCKKGPHIQNVSPSSGDLFGPYFITTNCEEFERRLEDPYDKQFRSKKFIKSIDSSPDKPLKKLASKRKVSESEEDHWLGIVATSNDSYEVWMHEDCLVWSPNVYLVGAKIIGLEGAVWTSCNVNCTKCNYKGANVCCLTRGCVKVAHFYCAKLLNWDFDEVCFKVKCDVHRQRMLTQ